MSEERKYGKATASEICDILKAAGVKAFSFDQYGGKLYIFIDNTSQLDTTQSLVKAISEKVGEQLRVEVELFGSAFLNQLPDSFKNNPETSDPVNHPSHYNSGRIEVIEALEDWNLPFHSATAIKYLARAGRKDPTKEVEDLRKAVWYTHRRIELLEAKTQGRPPLRPNQMVTK